MKTKHKNTRRGLNRLLKLAAHLRSGQLAHKVFDFAHYNYGAILPDTCGYSGCAVGECPAVWPKSWRWHNSYVCLKRSKSNDSPYTGGMSFFGLSGDQFAHLFVPSSNPESGQLPFAATKDMVAQRIEEFVKRRWRHAAK